ncbi:FKBP-type peptidyl-prolyl cis-trans isomerase [Zunongwangia sp. HRR-M8]|uniref:FKBP-type peptidyl-prolyl cis-trans isomerase n=1 Tax=Zunongwangia sp. HRR-M8 TaxID=3015170 RepID=UPI0022DD1603|nr:hypothetical protein [Zunongwangia sp. HRR-M8]WBL21578.1 hypothetical protein PBT89_12615 [Zunongwangia sp. HRR-M8]
MRLNKYFLAGITLASLSFTSCNDDDDNNRNIPQEELRDETEQALTDDDSIVEYLQTHFYNYEEFENPSSDFDYRIVFDTIAGENSDKESIFESDFLETKKVPYRVNETEVDYNLYILKVREGEGERPHFSDSTYVRYKGELLNSEVFDNSVNSPVWFDLVGYIYEDFNNGQPVLRRAGGVVPAFREAMTEFQGASSYTVNGDNTVNWSNDYGIGALFAPSGLGYFNGATGGNKYSPLIFTFELLNVNEADHDGDGIPSWMEDINENRDLYDDDTDGDGLPNFSDNDDDGDGLPTRQEIIINADGTITFPDSNNNGTSNHLDPDYFQPVGEE